MVNHGLSTGLLFFAIGMVYDRTHTREMGEMGGLGRVTPWIAGVFLVATVSSIGLPGLNNFVGEFLVILGAFASNGVLGAFAVTGVVLAAIYMLWAYQRTFQGPTPSRWSNLRDILPREIIAAVPVIAAMLVIGVYPKVVLDRINPSSDGVVKWVQAVEIEQQDLPGGLRAQVEPSYAPPPEVVTQAEAARGTP
jgi:NADH-quinone oxidoreductase subunit M